MSYALSKAQSLKSKVGLGKKLVKEENKVIRLWLELWLDQRCLNQFKEEANEDEELMEDALQKFQSGLDQNF